MSTLKAVLTTIVLGLAGTCASAATQDEPPTLTVNFADLDVTRSEGATQLFHRLRAAAKDVCSPIDGKTLAQRHRYRVCVDTALANAIQRVNQPLVNAAAETAGVKPIRLAKS